MSYELFGVRILRCLSPPLRGTLFEEHGTLAPCGIAVGFSRVLVDAQDLFGFGEDLVGVEGFCHVEVGADRRKAAPGISLH